MSMYANLVATLSCENIKNKLTLEERAELLIDITEDIGWYRFTGGSLNKENIERAMKDLQNFD